MIDWLEDFRGALGRTGSAQEAFELIALCARRFGFDYCAYGLRLPLPFTKPKTLLLSNYDGRWQQRYLEAGYLAADPTVAHGLHSCVPVVWSDALFRHTPQLWAEARSFGLRVGWAQSCFDAGGVVGMLSVVRSHEAFSPAELAANDARLRWLTNIAHETLSAALGQRQMPAPVRLTPRETDVLRWAGDGKTSAEIAQLLSISSRTVNFHMSNVNSKLNAANKTAAVARAVALGLLV